MASKSITKGLKRTALSVALGMCFAGSVYAQSNSTGSIAGTTTAGSTVVIENAATGFRREVTADSNGNYRVGSLATGSYKVTANGQSRDVRVTIGGTATPTLDVVQVQGSQINAIDVASVESTTIITAEQIAKLPVPRNITAVALLAPGTVRGDSTFGNLASFGGASVSENAYFVNGFNITNAFKNLAFAQVPFEGIAEQQIKTGGYGAEFGRSLGGVINLVTKRGSNEFHAGGSVFWAPESLRETAPDQRWTSQAGPCANSTQVGNCLIADNSKDKGSSQSAQVWASGALIQDRLFGYALIQYGTTEGNRYPGSTSGVGQGADNFGDSSKDPTWLVKLDWNISDNHIVEFTAFSDTSKIETDVYATQFGTTAAPTQTPTRDYYKGTIFDETGGNNYVLKYTGYLTDNFTLSALYGTGEYKRSNYAVAANGVVERYEGNLFGPVAGCSAITDSRSVVLSGAVPPRIGCSFAGDLGLPGAKDTRDQFRVDAEWVLGDHLVKFGIDTDNFETIDGGTREGGGSFQYFTRGGVEYVRTTNVRQGTQVKVKQKAYYIQDNWQVTDNFVAYAGARWDSFKNLNGSGDAYVDIKNQFSPRLGFSWDVNGDSKFKVYGSAGRYALPLTSTVAVRGGGTASVFLQQDYTYSGVDPATNKPIDLILIPNPTTNPICNTYTLGTPGPRFCETRFVNNEFGVAKTDTFASENLQPQYQDEYILGFQVQLTDNVTGGVRGIYRDLKQAIDDTCAYDIFGAEEADNQGLEYHPQNPGFSFCHIWNPGSDLIITGDLDGDGTLENITVDGALLSPKAKRTYKALDFFMEGHWDRFYLQGSYTWAKSYGNTEGGVKSDNGQDDTGTTTDFDKIQLTYGAEGYLPNDRRHSLKLFGSYDLTDEWAIGANVLVQSGRPINCFGVYAADPVGYGANYFSCGPNFSEDDDAITPRGTSGRLPWTRSLDLQLSYTPKFADGKLRLGVDVFNVFNGDSATDVSETGELGSTGEDLTPTTYKTPTGWQTPRSVRFSARYEF